MNFNSYLFLMDLCAQLIDGHYQFKLEWPWDADASTECASVTLIGKCGAHHLKELEPWLLANIHRSNGQVVVDCEV
jgi:hypothetical protein